MEKVVIVGGGSWGTALGKVLGEKGFNVNLLVRRSAVAEAINKENENPFYLPGVKLPRKLKALLDPVDAFKSAKLAVWCVPSHALKDAFTQVRDLASKIEFHISGIKGIDLETGVTPFKFLKQNLPKECKVFVLGGPCFAKEIVKRLPAAVVLAGEDEAFTKKLQETIAYSYFRVYRSTDPVGVEIAGVLKNVIAIASGICDGMGLGLNARAALITRGLIEMVRLGVILGGELTTFYGLAGMGDLVLTCTGALSRNYQVGLKLAQGKKLEEILNELHQVAEGVKTCKVISELARKHQVEVPICQEVYKVIYEKEDPKEGLKRLLSRELKREFDEPLLTKQVKGFKIDL